MARSEEVKAQEEAERQRYLAKIKGATVSSPFDINNNEDSNKDSDYSDNEDNSHEDADGLGPLRKAAKQLGWVDKRDWTRSPEAWEDADKFFEKIPTKIKSLEEQSEKMARAAAEAMEEAHRRARQEAEAEMLAAIEMGNKELAKAAAKKMTHSDDAVQVMKWQQANPWFVSKDPKHLAAIGLAKEISNREAEKGMPTEIQLARAEAAVRSQFPQLFRKSSDEVKLSENRKETRATPPVVQAGNRNSTPNPVPATAWSGLRPSEKTALSVMAQKLSKKYKMPLAEAQELMAKSYQKKES